MDSVVSMGNLEIKWNMWIMWLSYVPQGPQVAEAAFRSPDRHCRINRQFRAQHGRMGTSLYRRHRYLWRPTMAAVREAFPSAEPGFGKHLNNRAEISALAASSVRSVTGGRWEAPPGRGLFGGLAKRLRGNPENRGPAGGASSLLQTRLRCLFPVRQGKYRESKQLRGSTRSMSVE